MERTFRYRDFGLTVFASPPLKKTPRELGANLLRLVQSSLARSVGWSVVGSAFAQGGSLLSSLVLARTLGRESFGQFALIQSTVTAFTCVASLGLGLTATKYISEYRASQPEKIGRLLGFSLVLVVLTGLLFSIVLVACAPMLAVRADHAGLGVGFRLSAIYVFFQTLIGYQLGVLVGFEAFRSIGRIGIACGLASPLLSWWGALKYGIPGAVVAQCAGATLLWLLYEVAVRAACRQRGINVQIRGAWEQRLVLTQVSIPAATCGMVWSLAAWGSNNILVRACGYGELAIFTAVYNLRSVVMFLPSLIFRVAAPRLNYMFAMGDLTGYIRAFWRTVETNAALALFWASLAFLGGHLFVGLFGKQFAGSNSLLGLFLCSVVIEVTAGNLYMALIASGRFWWNLAIISLWALLLLAASALAAPRFGATGLAIAYLAAWSLAATLYAASARKQIHEEEQS
ncbi:MAG TPA: oligosaccharide flippase family protein [Bryobacteraceae bacterium]|nr:oligosaccharide flippase family protein [Bryobacteraceae bacterium]